MTHNNDLPIGFLSLKLPPPLVRYILVVYIHAIVVMVRYVIAISSSSSSKGNSRRVERALERVVGVVGVEVIEGSLEVKLPTIWTDEHSQEEAEPGRNSDVEKTRRQKIRDGES